MKQYLSFLSLLISAGFATAQVQRTQASVLPASKILRPEVRNAAVVAPVRKTHNDRVINLQSVPNPTVAAPGSGRTGNSEVLIGKTTYDLQTNSAMPRRIVNYGGKVSAIWTLSTEEEDEYPDRGIGYNHFDGNSWINLPAYINIRNNNRIETVRTGFGSIGAINGREVVIAHDAETLYMSTNDEVGSQNWAGKQLTFPRSVWSRMASNGDNIHVIAYVDTNVWMGETLFEGMSTNLLYSRSTDGGSSWDIRLKQLPGFDSTRYKYVNGDCYSIDVKGDNIAVAYGSELGSIIVAMSDDNGDNWTYRVVKEFPYSPWDDQYTITNGVQDTINSTDGSIAVHIGNDGKVHVFYGAMRVTKGLDLEPGYYTYFPAHAGIYYWNDSFEEEQEPELIGGYVDEDNDGAIDIMVRYGSYTKSGDQYVFAGNDGPFPYSGIGGTTTPTVGEDADGNLYMVYQAYKEGEEYFHLANYDSRYGPSFRHLFLMRSYDGGATWADPVDITDGVDRGFDPYVEFAFPSIARFVDDKIHLVYMCDDFPGNVIGTDNLNYHPITENQIVYQSLPRNTGTGVNKVTESVKAELNPNPANEFANLNFSTKQTGTARISVTNLLGQEVFNSGNQTVTAGSHQVQLDTRNLIPGIYLVNLQIGNTTKTTKLVVSH